MNIIMEFTIGNKEAQRIKINNLYNGMMNKFWYELWREIDKKFIDRAEVEKIIKKVREIYFTDEYGDSKSVKAFEELEDEIKKI